MGELALRTPDTELEWLGCDPSSRLAFALEAPRISVIIIGRASPANIRSTISLALRAWLMGVRAATPTKATRKAAVVR